MATKCTSLSLSRLTCQIPNISGEILSLIKTKEGVLFHKEFVQNFLIYVPIDYNITNNIELFSEFTDKAFEFFKCKIPNKRKIEITNNINQNNNSLTILILDIDKPFIIDSIICLLYHCPLQMIHKNFADLGCSHEQNHAAETRPEIHMSDLKWEMVLDNIDIKPKFILHPVISCVRDENGNLTKISEVNSRTDHTESLVYIEIIGNYSEEIVGFLEKKINETLDQVENIDIANTQSSGKIKSIVREVQNNANNYVNVDCGESLDFLNWLISDNFTFFGSIEFDTNNSNLLEENGAKSIWQNVKNEIIDIITFSNDCSYEGRLIILGKINCYSPIYKNNLVDYILIKKLDVEGNYRFGSIIFGQYSKSIHHQSISHIPILRQKLGYVLNKSNFRASGHNATKLQVIIESLPKEALIQIDETDLYCMSIHMLSSIMSRKLKLFIQQDWSSSFVNLLIFLPRDRLTPEIHNEIHSYLLTKFNSKILSDHITEVAQNFSYLFVTMEVSNKNDICFLTEEIEADLDKLSTNWSDSFYQALCRNFDEHQASLYFKTFESVFPTNYRHKFNAGTAIEDLHYLKSSSAHGKITFNLIISNINLELKIYNPGLKLTLSDLLPFVENLGFKAIDQQSFIIKMTDNIKESVIYQFILSAPALLESNKTYLKINVEEALDKMANGFLSQDSLSKLVVLAGFNWQQVKLLRALTRYLHQTGFAYGKGYVQLTLIKHYKYTEALITFFDIRFNPINSNYDTGNITNDIETYLETIKSSSEDKVLRSMFSVIKAIVRTNLYQLNNGVTKAYISFKLNSSKIPNLPLPIPFAEIFVYSNEFEAIHLRGGKVARGGIRWSDRGEDYRTEVLGLMKAQMTKNTVIVPVGSKGTFFVQYDPESLSNEEYFTKGVDCYKNFLRGLLDITDNIIEGNIVHPANTIIYDEPDPYLVVAADKGTGTFSDYANSISAEYNFWLGDAFASGGSFGYDHKKMAITSKGAWISVQNHFQELGIDVQKDPISVVGIGDMSGDVFGNGMLRSKVIKLVAAFNHKYIFIDPTPNPEISFNERARLFTLARSNWSDYNIKLISNGGGVFERSAKIIKLSVELQNLLQIKEQQLSPDDLIKCLLKAPIDLIWNGGIGTYVKATTESHLEIGDKSNDMLRCNGKDVRAKVVAEGGNLGVSQKGRIEYSMNHGHINTDFIDNSAGVDCSDHEVNIKIALNQAVYSGKLSLNERNRLLSEMTSEVEELVLMDNHKQTQAITIMQLSPSLNIEVFSQLIKSLEEEGLLDRYVEFLPDKAEITRRILNKEQMTRPELAVLLSYSKMSVYNELIKSDLTNDRYFEPYLINYFPKLMQKDFRKEIISHPLAKEIIITLITNKIVNQLGGYLINIIKHETGCNIHDIVRAYNIACELFELDNLWHNVESVSTRINYNVKIDMFNEITKILGRAICCLLKHQNLLNIIEHIDEFKESSYSLSIIMQSLLVGEMKCQFQDKIERYKSFGIDESLAKSISMLDSLVSVFDIIYVAKQTNSPNDDVAKCYFLVGNKFNIDWLRDVCEEQTTNSYWDKLSIKSLKDDLYDKQRQLLIKIISNTNSQFSLDSWIESNSKHVDTFFEFIEKIKLRENVNLHIIILANKNLDILLRRLE
jgi:glutamate dehydrogenase